MIRTSSWYWYECDLCHRSESEHCPSNVEASAAAKASGWTFLNGVHRCQECKDGEYQKRVLVAPPPQKKLKELKIKPAPLFGDDL